MSASRLPRWTRLRKLACEPPVRLLVRSVVKRLPVSVTTRAFWDLSDRPSYLRGLLFAAEQARMDGVPAFSAIEFGVASGSGLVALQREAEAVEKHTGVSIQVYGFDNGPHGLPEFIGDYRDNPDMWMPGDFHMDEKLLRSQLTPRTHLILGNVKDTVPTFFDQPQIAPVGFISVDLDLYSSTTHALRILSMPERRILKHVPVYFDDIEEGRSHRFGGELLAIDEFNEANQTIKIDVWRGVRTNRPFSDANYLQKMYMAHDLEAISRSGTNREPIKFELVVGGARVDHQSP
jgi:hypothetical protein